MSEATDLLRQSWACPACGAGSNEHGRGECQYEYASDQECEGLICECADEGGPNHGETMAEPCPLAVCYHCGWEGSVPSKPVDTSTWPDWAKTALAAGWRPPTEWKP